MVAWMVVLDRLPTRSRLISFGLNVESLCLLCNRGEETRGHLFFQCEFSSRLWFVSLSACGFRRSVLIWGLELDWMCCMTRGCSLPALVLRLAWNDCIYMLWRERNERVFGRAKSSVEEVFKRFQEIVRLKLSGRVKQRQLLRHSALCESWDLLV
ncbi:uncharacterized protein LOC120135602 [Hibiscus syriacus]|uniref:uncharacterized protein LOC120135602 n=1 Tax=Hibiscus syriacus TaxID=106335 RepID=UPI001921C638|nr:uncharacterized protein LOC120135602 [Hibiscus syriacus]